MIKHLIFGIFAASSAAAQDLTWTPDATEACLEEGEDQAALEACIGASADICIDTRNGSTTVGMGFCLSRELDFWDARLNAAYQSLMATEKALMEEMADINANVPDTAAALRDMQRAWIPWRDAACAYEYSTWGGGTGGGPANAACLMQITGRQALSLERRVSDTQ
ncbi:MAG: DUF1311 domain-containing protein [Boseongicola sp.]|nr:DUF1311 domain-containing protein [Boseongicola sp.]MDD9976166.1 DUF1311 domain-containing protein [Boseongicola sp.]